MADRPIKTEAELAEIADLMAKEIKSSDENIVLRYMRAFYDNATFLNGQKLELRFCEGHFNKEQMSKGEYAATSVDDLRPDNFNEVTVARDLGRHKFNFCPKGVALPTDISVFYEKIPSTIDMFDEEFKDFTKNHRNTRLARGLKVDQVVIANSKGGNAIQSVPFFAVSFSKGYNPIPMDRDISVVCNSENDIKNVTKLIKYLADPTPDKRIKKAKTFSEAFHELYKISSLKHGSLQDAGIPTAELYDVVMLTGVPVHEIFGHHFEEPIKHLSFGESATFRAGQTIKNKDIILSDNPAQSIEGLRPYGFTNVDAYGRKRTARMHIKNGEVLEFLGSEYADPENLKSFLGLEKSKFLGNAVQHIDGLFPQPRMTCTFLDGPTEDVDLEGKILLVPHSGYTIPSDKTYRVNAKEAYVVKDGEPQRVIPLQVTGGINQALANLVLLNDTSYQIGTCGKLNPLYDPIEHPDQPAQANAPVSQFARSQLWKGQQVYPRPLTDKHIRILVNKY